MKARPIQSRKGVKGQLPLAGSRDSVPCGVWGNAPTVGRVTSLSNALNKGAGSEASLPVTSRVLRRAPKLLYRPTVQCRAKWARPHSLPAPISASKTQPEDSQHPPTYLTPLLHICHIPNPPRKHQQLPGRKTCEKNASVTVSRVLSRDDHLSRPDVAAQVQAMPRTRRAAACVLIRILHQMGFTARTSRQAVGELLPRLSILTAPKCGGISLLHSPWSRLHRPLAGILPCGARTFLIPLLARDRLITSHRCIIAQKARFVKGRLLTQNARCAIMDASIWVEDENHETLYRNAPDALFCAPDDGGFRGRGCP